MNMKMAAIVLIVMSSAAVQAKVSPEEAARLGKDLTLTGAEAAANKDGSIPAYTGGSKQPAPAKGKERSLESFPEIAGDKPLYTITAANLAEYADKLSVGHQTMLKRFPTYKMNVYETERSSVYPDFYYEATKKCAVEAELGNNGDSLVNAVTGIPFPIPKSGLEIIWNHKVRFRGTGTKRYNTQLAVQTSGDFQPVKLREDVRLQYSYPNQKPADLNNTLIYFMQITTSPARLSGNVLLVHETMDQVKEPRRAWLYNPGQRRLRRAPNVGYDNPGTGSDGLRTNDQFDVFNGATDRYTWKVIGKKEMIFPYNAVMLAQDKLKYSDIAKKGHIDQNLARYEKHRVWIVEAELKPGVSHLYARRTFYVDEDTWTILHSDIYDRRKELWRIHESHNVSQNWEKRFVPVAAAIYDLQSSRYLVMDLSNEEPLYEDKEFPLEYYDPANVSKLSTK